MERYGEPERRPAGRTDAGFRPPRSSTAVPSIPAPTLEVSGDQRAALPGQACGAPSRRVRDRQLPTPRHSCSAPFWEPAATSGGADVGRAAGRRRHERVRTSRSSIGRASWGAGSRPARAYLPPPLAPREPAHPFDHRPRVGRASVAAGEGEGLLTVPALCKQAAQTRRGS
jgi:hypothetical protein